MAEHRTFELCAFESDKDFVSIPPDILRGLSEQSFGNYVDIAFDIDSYVFEFRMKGDGHVRWDGPWRSGPDEAVNTAAGECGIDRGGIGCEREPHEYRRARMVLILYFGFSGR